MGCLALLHEIVAIQGSNLHLLHCRWILYQWATREDRGVWCPWGRKDLDTTEWLHFHFHQGRQALWNISLGSTTDFYWSLASPANYCFLLFFFLQLLISRVPPIKNSIPEIPSQDLLWIEPNLEEHFSTAFWNCGQDAKAWIKGSLALQVDS